MNKHAVSRGYKGCEGGLSDKVTLGQSSQGREFQSMRKLGAKALRQSVPDLSGKVGIVHEGKAG